MDGSGGEGPWRRRIRRWWAMAGGDASLVERARLQDGGIACSGCDWDGGRGVCVPPAAMPPQTTVGWLKRQLKRGVSG
jgi:hypothetical protein